VESRASRVSGYHERRLAVGALAQQGAQAVATLSLLAAVTVLARRLSLAEFGTYGLLVSLTSYVLFAQAAIATAAVKAIAEARDQAARERAFSTAVSLYVLAGLAVGGVIAAGGTALLSLLNISPALHHQATVGVVALGVITAFGWPLKVFEDVLRADQLFVASAVVDGAASVIVGAALVGLALAGAPLWLLVATGASIPTVAGALSAAAARTMRVPLGFDRRAFTARSLRNFLALSGYLFFAGVADVVIYSLDRFILAGFRSASAVGLYEGPARAHNFLQQIHTTLVTPVMPASARYLAEHDAQRVRDLLLRGSRYTLAAVVPVTIVLMILARPILEVWLGSRFGQAATAMTVLAGYWLLNAGTGVAGRMLIAAGRVRTVAAYAGAVALANLALSLALTPALGLNGVVLGTTIAYVVGFPFFLRIVLSVFPVTITDFAREVWCPAYLTGAVVAAGLVAVRVVVPLDTVGKVFGVGLAAVLVYWAIYYFVWLNRSERALVKNLLRAPTRR